MTRLIVCCDGTWNTPDQRENGEPSPTNVVKFYNALAAEAEGVEQRLYYHSGVGTEGGWLERIAGGGLGKGLDDNVKSAYYWLARNYALGDSIWLLGFSRGAYTARSVGGMISRCGLMDLRAAHTVADGWAAVDIAFAAYRRREDMVASTERPFHHAGPGARTRQTTGVHFIGVWDTVGSLGIPDDFALLDLIDDPKSHEFHDCALSPIVEHARHAVAMDEFRHTFSPTLWTEVKPESDVNESDVKQIWFPGVHGDVGGGYARCGLSDGALLWMMEEAGALGLGFRPGIQKRLQADALGVLHDLLTGIFRKLKKRPRAVPRVWSGGPAGELHKSAIDRADGASFDHKAYWATIALEDGMPVERDIFARDPWNATGIFLEAGKKYDFAAAGEWIDGSVRCGPGGASDGRFQIGEVLLAAGSLIDETEALWRRLSRNARAELWYSRREAAHPWFALIGVVANGADGGHETFRIGEQARFTPNRGGYLYCFANDAWEAYRNNRGSVQLTVRLLDDGGEAAERQLVAAGH